MNTYQTRQGQRKARYHELAEDLENQSDAVYEEAQQTADYRQLAKSFEIQAKAKYYRSKAAAVGKGGISSDDPDAIEQLQAKLNRLEKHQEKMKRANLLIRKENHEELKQMGFDDAEIGQLFKPDFAGRIGFPDYALKNNNAEIRRLKQRFLALTSLKTREDISVQKEGFIYREDKEENRILFEFNSKPDEAIRTILKSHGFRWSPTRSAWIRQLNNAGLFAAKSVISKLSTMALDYS